MGPVLITGGARRLGRAIALRLAKEGMPVVIHHGQSPGDALDTVSIIQAAGGQAAAVQADLADRDTVGGLISVAAACFGPLTGLVNNASVFIYDTATAIDSVQWDRTMDVNLRAPLVLAAGLAAQVPEGITGSVVNLLDSKLFGITGPEFFSYTLSKAGLASATTVMAQGLAPRVRVNGIAPGLTLPAPRQSQERFDALHGQTILARGSTADDVAEATAYLMTAPAVTGQVITVDGGERFGNRAYVPADAETPPTIKGGS